jgi:protein KTI12
MLSEQCNCYIFAVSNWHAWADFQIDPHEKEFDHYLEEPPCHTNVWYLLAKLFLSLFGLQAILSAQKLGLEGEVKIPGYKDCVLLTNGANMTAAQLTRLRRQFLAYTKLHPSNDISKIGSLFVQFLNTSLR